MDHYVTQSDNLGYMPKYHWEKVYGPCWQGSRLFTFLFQSIVKASVKMSGPVSVSDISGG